MGIIRVAKNANYSVISNGVLRSPLISARAKGIWAYLMTLPDDWRLHKSELCKHFTEGRDALNSAFAELEEHGYISKSLRKNKSGTIEGWEYTIHEEITVSLETRQTVFPSDGFSEATNYLEKPSTDHTNLHAARAAKKPKDTMPYFEARPDVFGIWGKVVGGHLQLGRSGCEAMAGLEKEHGKVALLAAWERFAKSPDHRFGWKAFANRFRHWQMGGSEAEYKQNSNAEML